jgi:hypothetical protein
MNVEHPAQSQFVPMSEMEVDQFEIEAAGSCSGSRECDSR